MYLVTFQRDWADEFYVYGFKVMDSQEVEDLKEWASQPHTCWFGTNEGWEDEIFLGAYKFQELAEEEAAVLSQLFPHGFGYMPVEVDYGDD